MAAGIALTPPQIETRAVASGVTMRVPGLPVHNDDLEAVANGLQPEDWYRTPTGEIRVVV